MAGKIKILARVNLMVYLFLFIINFTGSAESYDPNPDLLSSYETLLDFRLNDSRQQIKGSVKQNTQNIAFSIILLSLADIIEISLTDDYDLYKKHLKNF